MELQSFNLSLIPSGNKVLWLLLPIPTVAAERSSKKAKIHVGTISKLTQRRTRILEEKEIYHLTMPELQNNLVRGSCHGWVIMVLIYEGTIRMLNPFTKVCFDLLPISTLPNVIDIHGDKCIIDLESTYGTLEMDTISMHKINVYKVITNSAPNNDRYNDFMAVVIYGGYRKLAFYKANDTRWIKFPTSHKMIVDVIFFQEKVYAVDFDHQLYEFHIKKKLEPVRRIYEGTPLYQHDTNIMQYSYLIGCDDGSLLMVVRHIRLTKHTEWWRYYKTIKFDIYKLNKNAKVWSRIYDLGNYVLVVGLNSSIQILASNCKGNKIYFTDSMVGLHPDDDIWRHDIGVFNLKDNSCRRVLSDVNFFCPPVWILS
ncbi:hypothetical protein HN51_015625 [Arachis hypogaea]|uniref:KIB1-4 beta-propeller domain-containing protein n=2 Tax=Arachis hypogaea TaxID=3818 RepID=A0A445CJS4_ARAHY|nr:putative F-box protein At5g55150 [Arachis hypogaea]RYR51160.1 hypothetical protein Ahy_A06g026206 isoform B [Arachis hypogaea]